MQQRGKCGVTRQAQVPRRSFGMLAEGGALPGRMELPGPTSGAVASDCNRFYTPTSLNGDGPRRRRTSDPDTQSAPALYQGVARGDQNSCHSGYRDRESKTVAAAIPRAAFDDLLGCPLGRRMPRNVDVEDLSIGKPDHEEDIERLE
jgi:hypothetical protein